MSEKSKTKFAIKVDKIDPNRWSIGVCISHWWTETYLYLNLLKWSISIGFLDKDTFEEAADEPEQTEE